MLQTVCSAEQSRKDCGVSHENVPSAFSFGRHPDACVELCITSFGERMWAAEVDRLARQNVDGFCVVCGQCIVWQVWMEIEGSDSIQ